jgi:processive 1,2-diacylglycerol beta-glucosyltransferase
MKKVLITYASAGDGHKKAAEAVYESFLNSNHIHSKVVLIDSLEYTRSFFGFAYKKSYEIMIKYVPWLWGFFYHTLNNRLFFVLVSPFRRCVNGFNSKKIIEFILKENFDIIISTHFFVPEVISDLKQKGLSSVKLFTVVTDFKPHRFWIAKHTDRYFVASDITKKGFVEMGLNQDSITVSGVPIGKKFTNIPIKEKAREDMGMAEDIFTVLLMGGGLGVGPIEKIFLGLQKLDYDIQIIVVCGRNKKLVERLNCLNKGLKNKASIYGFNNRIDLLMASSDIIISKTGGVTVSESLAAGLPMIIIRPIPGQEASNAQFLCDNGVGFRVKRIEYINAIITRLYKSKDDIKTLGNTINSLSKPHAADDIVALSMEMHR